MKDRTEIYNAKRQNQAGFRTKSFCFNQVIIEEKGRGGKIKC